MFLVFSEACLVVVTDFVKEMFHVRNSLDTENILPSVECVLLIKIQNVLHLLIDKTSPS